MNSKPTSETEARGGSCAPVSLLADDPIIESLKKRYFDVISKEDYPNTPKLTQEADHIERAVRKCNTPANAKLTHGGDNEKDNQ